MGCIEEIENFGGKPCSAQYCNYMSIKQSDNNHYYCDRKDADRIVVPNCRPRDAKWPITVIGSDGNTRYCGCSCFAFGTPIAVSEFQFKPIEELRVGDDVMAADTNGTGLTWRKQKVCMSSGTRQKSDQQEMIEIRYGKNKVLVVTPNHLFLIAGGKLKRANCLVSGQDQLIDDKGNAVLITQIFYGVIEGGVHHIATSLNPSRESNGHLLNSNGIVSADFALEVGYLALDESTRYALIG